MKVRLVSNLRDEKGLAKDAALVGDLLSAWGHEVELADFREPSPSSRPDLTVHFEVVGPELSGTRHWLMPNPENPPPLETLERFEFVLCKTRETFRLFSPLVGARAVWTGFLSEDRRDPTPRERRFWHNPGTSSEKGTQAISEAWRRFRPPWPLTLVGAPVEPIPNVSWTLRLQNADHRQEQNRHLFHLCPSRCEGWGHYLHEALSVGAVVISTDAPPMNEFEGIAIRLPAAPGPRIGLATTWDVSPEAISGAARRCAALNDQEILVAQQAARSAFESERDGFAHRFRELLR